MQKLCSSFPAKLVAFVWTLRKFKLDDREWQKKCLSGGVVTKPCIRAPREVTKERHPDFFWKVEQAKEVHFKTFAHCWGLYWKAGVASKRNYGVHNSFFSGLNKFLDRIIVNYLESGQFLGFFGVGGWKGQRVLATANASWLNASHDNGGGKNQQNPSKLATAVAVKLLSPLKKRRLFSAPQEKKQKKNV